MQDFSVPFFIFMGIFMLYFILKPLFMLYFILKSHKNSAEKKRQEQISTIIDDKAENSTSVPTHEKSQTEIYGIKTRTYAPLETAKPILRFPNYIEIAIKPRGDKGHFYEVCIGRTLEKENYKVKYPGLNRFRGDGGIDIIARDNEFTWIIQCKNFQNGTKVSPKDIHAHYGVVELYRRRHARPDEKVLGAFFSNSGFSDQSQSDAKTLNITLCHVEVNSSHEKITIRTWNLPILIQYRILRACSVSQNY